jgi:chaperonin GroEL
MTDVKTQKCEFEKCSILLVDGKVSSLESIVHLLEACRAKQSPLVIIAEDVDGDALTGLIVNKIQGVVKCVAIKAPGFGKVSSSSFASLPLLNLLSLFFSSSFSLFFAA